MVIATIERESVNQSSFVDLFYLQNDFNHTLRLPDDPSDLLKRSYNPVTDRWHVEKLREESDSKRLKGFKEEVRKNMETNLMERLHAAESYGEYSIKNEELYSKEFPEKSFGQVIRNGAEYRRQLGSKEKEREGDLGEVAGWEYIRSVMADSDTPLGTTVVSFSPPGLVKDSEYTGRFVDKFILEENNKGRYIKRVRLAVDWTYDEYKKVARQIDPTFFDGYDGRPLDAWFLSHPIKNSENIFDKSKNGMTTDKFQHIFENPSLQRLIRQYEKVLYREKINWWDLAISFNAILNYVDDLKKSLSNITLDENIYQSLGRQLHLTSLHGMDERTFLMATKKLGTRKVQSVGGGGCPTNKGINLNGNESSSDIFSNSVAKFGIEKKLGACKECQGSAGDNHYHCPECNKEYADETDRSQEARTKECGCGFKFGC